MPGGGSSISGDDYESYDQGANSIAPIGIYGTEFEPAMNVATLVNRGLDPSGALDAPQVDEEDDEDEDDED